MSITALPCLLHAVSRHALFMKAMPTNYTICHNFNYHINNRETPKTCLTNHKCSISHHITPLVINSLRGRHTHVHTHTRIQTSWTKVISRNQAHSGLWLARVSFKKCMYLLYPIAILHSSSH